MDYFIGDGERTLGAAAPRPWGFPRAVGVVADANSHGAAASRPAGFPLAVYVTAADDAAGVLLVKPLRAVAADSAAGILFVKPIIMSPAEGSAGAAFGRVVVAPAAAEGSAGVAAAWVWLVGLGERSAGILAERPPVRHFLDARGLYRVFNAPHYRFYRSRLGPPAAPLAPFATSLELPAEPPDVFSDGTWYLSVSYFNGVVDSGFLPLGPGGETFLLLTISDNEDVSAQPPAAPLSILLASVGGGATRITAIYYEDDAARAEEWAVAYTTDGTEPPADAPDITADLPAAGLAILNHELPAAADGATLRVRLQTRRNDGTDAEPAWVYSPAADAEIVIDAAAPPAPPAADRWTGQIVES